MHIDLEAFYGNALQFAAVLALAGIVEYRGLPSRTQANRGARIGWLVVVGVLAVSLLLTIIFCLIALSGIPLLGGFVLFVIVSLAVATLFVIAGPFMSILKDVRLSGDQPAR